MIFDVIFDVTVCLSFQYHKILEFWHHHCVPRVKICIHTNFQLNSIICWYSNIIWMTLWTILWYLTSYLASQYRLTPSKSQNFKILTSQSVFHPKKTQLYALWDQQSFYWDFRRFSSDSGNILGHIGGPWRHKRGQNFRILYFGLCHRFSFPKNIAHAHC